MMVSFNELNKIVTLASDATVKMLKEECFSFQIRSKYTIIHCISEV